MESGEAPWVSRERALARALAGGTLAAMTKNQNGILNVFGFRGCRLLGVQWTRGMLVYSKKRNFAWFRHGLRILSALNHALNSVF